MLKAQDPFPFKIQSPNNKEMKNTFIHKLVFLTISILMFAQTSQAASDYAPETVKGGILKGTITSGSGWFAPSGKFILIPASAGTAYTIYGGPGVDGTVGTYSYTKLGPNSAQLVLNDSDLGMTISQSITFSSPTTGNYFISNAYGSQSGYFSFSVPQSSTSSDWKYDAYYPWVWNHRSGWLYYLPTDEGLMIYNQGSGTWTLQES